MRVSGSTALVTGADRALGRAFTRALLEHGAARVVGTTSRPGAVTEPGVDPVRLDITDHGALARLAGRLDDVELLVNSGAFAPSGLPLDVATDEIRTALEVNLLGPLVATRAFAPVLAANGGGAVVSVLSVLSWVARPAVSAYAASLAAAWSMTNALRVQLRSQGTLVVGVHSAFADTATAATGCGGALRASDVADAAMFALAGDQEEVLVDEVTRTVKSALHDDLGLLYPAIEREYALIGTEAGPPRDA